MFENYELEILYKDDYLVAINKPSGLLVHKSMIDRHEIYYAMKMLRDQIGAWVYPVHRLDKPTSGVLLFALDSHTSKLLNEQFKAHATRKKYIAVVRGYTDESGLIEHALKEKLDKISDKDAQKDKGAQDAITEYKRVETVEIDRPVGRYEKTRYSLVELLPQTGRKHQLRRHMKHISHHILGDTKYGRGEHNKFIRAEYGVHRLLLHCVSLELQHPYSGANLIFKAKLDATFQKLFNEFGWQDKIEFYN
ncbi:MULTISPECIES: tRNA pseudouridine(65) synthase TruC [Sulfurimonas]|uniref:tRNA pseudouridine(65) synthase TruC n=1 Tax=Sulfurimonas TaxID=202746 RepID=UPI00126525FC|nr:tRNA pseudouridine(65) synthase TruC [Sulfurimonas indica]